MRIDGWVHNPQAVDKIMESLEKPYFFQAADILKQSGKGKSAFLWKAYESLGIPYPAPIQSSVGDCVSHAVSLAVDTLAVTEITSGERETWVARCANEYIYHVSRFIVGRNQIGGDGSINAWAFKGVVDYGTLRRIKYDLVDLTKYSPERSRKWGSSKIESELLSIGKENNVQSFAAINNFSDAADSLYNGYPIAVASNQGFSDSRDKDGFCAPQGSWGHSMGVIGYKDDARPGVVIANSWSSYLPGENKWGLPPSCFFCDAHVFDRMCKMGDTFSVCGFNGFKPKTNARVI